jgi:hypothetical protein
VQVRVQENGLGVVVGNRRQSRAGGRGARGLPPPGGGDVMPGGDTGGGRAKARELLR